MAVTISAANLPQFDGATGVPGKRRVLYVNYGVGATEKKPVWVLVGGAEDFTMSPTVNTQSKTTKDILSAGAAGKPAPRRLENSKYPVNLWQR